MARTSRKAPRTTPRQVAHLPLPRLARALLLGTTALLPLALLAPAHAQAPNAMPTGGQVTAGQALIQQQGNRTQITQGSDRAVIDWQRFDVGRDATVNFTQPSQNAWTLNRVNTPDPSLIAGRITANGGVAIVNPSGVVFAEGAQVNVGSLVATAAGITNQNFMAGRLVFDGQPNPGARVENRGEITVADRGLVALVAPGTANHGAIRARLGTAIVAGAETYRLDLAGDGLLSIDVTQAVRRAPDGATALVTNSGVIAAEGGQVVLTAQAASGLVEQMVRNTGQVTAGRVAIQGRGGDVAIAGGAVTAPGGQVDITAPGAGVTVAAGARVSASGPTDGGRMRVGGAGTVRTRVEGRVAARGTGPGARGGRVAVQATQVVTLAAGAVVDASGAAGGGEALVGTTGIGRAQEMARETRLEAGAVVRADATARGDGGLVAVNSGERTAMAAGLSARGGPAGGNGGFVEVSGMRGLTLNMLRVDVGAGQGGVPGTLLIDPVSIVVRDTVAVAPGEEDGVLAGAGFSTAPNLPGDPTTVVISTSDIVAFGGNVTLEAQESLVVADAITMPANSLTLTVTGAGGAGITISAPIDVQAGTLTLNSNSLLAVNAAITGNLGVGMNVALGVTGTGTVTTPNTLRVRGFDGTDVSGVQGLTLTGANSVGALDVIGLDASVAFAQPGTLNVARAQLGVNGALTLGSGGAVSGSNVVAGDLVIRGAGLADSASGGLSMTTGIAVARLDARVGAGPLNFGQAAALTVVQASNPGGVVRLGSDGLIQGGGVAAGQLFVTGSSLGADTRAGGLSLLTGNAVASLSARTNGTALGFTQAGSLLVVQANARTGAGAGVGSDGGTVTLQLTGAGSILSASGSVQGGSLVLTTMAGMTLADTLVATQGGITLTGSEAGSTLGQGAGATLTAPDGQAIALRFDGFTLGDAISAGATGTVVLARQSAGNLVLGAGAAPDTLLDPAVLAARIPDGTLRLETSGTLALASAITRPGALVLRSTDGDIALNASATVGANTLSLEAAGNVTGTGGVGAATLRVRGGDGGANSRAGGLDLVTAANAVTTLDARVADATLRFSQPGALVVTAADAGSGDVALGSNGVISGGGVVGGTLTIRNVALDSLGGGLDLAGAGNAIATLDALVIGGDLTFAQTASFVVANAIAGFADVTLGSDGAITGSGAGGNNLTIRGAALGTTRAGGLDLRGNFSGAIDARTADAALTYAQNNGFTVTQADAGTGDVTLGSAFAISGGGVVGGTLTIRGAGLGVERAGGLDLTTGNAIATLDARTSGALRFAQSAGLVLAQADADGADVTLGSGGTISGGGVVAATLTVRDAALDLADGRAGGLTLTGTNSIGALDARTDNTALAYSQPAAFQVLQANARIGAGAGVGTDGAAVTLAVTNPGATLTVPAAGGVQGGEVTLQATGTLALEGPVLATQGGVTLTLTAADGLLQQAAGGTVTAPDGQAITLTADRLTLGATMTADATGVVQFTRLSPGNIVIGAGAAPDTVLDPADIAAFLGTGHLRLIATDTITVQSALARTVGELTLRATDVAGGGIAVGAALDVGANTVNLETPAAIAGAGVITPANLVARGDADPASRAGSVNLTGDNLATRLNARTDGGAITFRNAANLRITRIDAAGGNVGVTLAGAGLLLEVANDISAGQLTLVADDMAITTGMPALIAPGGTVRLLPFTPGRGVTLGGEVAGTLSLSTAELAAIGGAGADGQTNPATVLRIGRLDATPVGDMAVAGAVDLAGRVLALELFAAGAIAGSGAITVADFGAVAGADLVLDGANAVGRLAPLTDAGSVNGVAPTLLSLWGGTRNSDPAGLAPARQPDRLEFRNTTATLVLDGSVLASGGGGLTLANAGNLTLPANRWIAAEAGAVNATATQALLNQGGILSGDLAGGTVAGGTLLTNDGAILLGPGSNASGTVGSAGVALANNGLIVAGLVQGGALTNAVGAELYAATLSGTAIGNDGTVLAGSVTGGALSNQGDLAAGGIVLTGDFTNAGSLAAASITAGGSALNSGSLLTGTLTAASVENTTTGTIAAGTGGGSNLLALPAPRSAVLAGAAAPATGVLDLDGTEGGDLDLRAAAGNVTQAGTLRAAEDITLDASGDLALTGGSVTAGDVLELLAGQDVLQTAGTIAAGGALGVIAGRDARQTGGSATAGSLGEAGQNNQAGQDFVWQVTTPAVFGVIAGRDLSLGVLGTGATLAGPLQAGGVLSVQVPGAALTLADGATLAATGALTLTAATDLTLPEVTLTSGGAMALVAGGALTLDQGSTLAGGDLTAQAGGNLTASGGARSAGGALRLTAGADLSLAGGSLVATGDLAAQATGTLSTIGTPLSAGGALALTSGGALLLAGGSLTSGGDLTVQSGARLTSIRTPSVAGGALRLLASGAVSLGPAELRAGSELAVEAGGNLSAGEALFLSGGALRLAAGGALFLSEASGAPPGAMRLAAGADLSATALGDVTLTRATVTAGGRLRLAAGGALTLEGGSLAGADVVLASVGTLAATGAGLTAARDLALGATAGNVALREVTGQASGGAIAITAAGEASLRDNDLRAGLGVTITAGGGLVMNPTVLEAGGDLALTSAGGMDISGGTLRAAQALRLIAGGTMRLGSVDLGASTAPADTPTAFRTLRLQAGGDLVFDGNILAADRAELVSGGALTTAGSRFTIGTGLLLAAPGGIGQAGEAATTVAPVAAGQLPLVILDTRRGVALARLPDALTPATTDRPGQSNAGQVWQVPGLFGPAARIFGVDDGVPALPSNAAAGGVFLNMDIGASPLFVLLNGGTASGTLQAGRLGVLGRPGAASGPDGRQVDLLGQLSGLEGIAAARFGILSGPLPGFQPAPGDLSQYRFNNCVISTVNCVAPITFTLPAVPQVNTLVLTGGMPRLDDSDVLLPNIADEDF